MDIQNIPAIVDEQLMPPRASLETHIDFYYLDQGLGNEAPVQYWNRITKQLNGEVDHFIDKKNALSSELAKIVAPTDSPEMKLRKIYARTLQIRNLSLEDAKTDKERKTESLKDSSNVQDLLERGAGNGRQIDFLLVGLARAAGFEANEVFVAPRTGDIFTPAAEDARQLQADVVWVKADGKEYYLDPGSRYYPFGLIPWFETGTAGLRVTNHGPVTVLTPTPAFSDAALLRTADLTVGDDGSISGTLQIDFVGHRGALLRIEKRKEDETGRIKDIEEDVKSWMPVGSTFEISKLENWDDVEVPIHVVGSLKITSVTSAAVQHLLVPREIFQPSEPALFATEKRVNDVYFDYPYEQVDDIELHAPAGYTFLAMPKDQKIDLGAAIYEATTVQQSGVAEVKRHMAMKGEVFSKQQYPNLRAFFGAVKTEDSSQILLQNGQTTRNN